MVDDNDEEVVDMDEVTRKELEEQDVIKKEDKSPSDDTEDSGGTSVSQE